MSIIKRNWNSWRCPNQLTLIVVASTAAWLSTARAQTTDSSVEAAAATTAPYALFQNSTITSSGNTINASCVPAIFGNSVKYWDVTIQFNVDTSGNLNLAGTPTSIQCPPLILGNFKAGQYVGPSNILSGKAIINVSSPGLGPGGTTKWSLVAAPGANTYTYPATATWYVGPIASNPYLARIQAAKIPAATQAQWYFGVGSGISSGNWYTNTLLGLSQSGNTITIVSFTYDDGGIYSPPVDKPEAVDTITYTLCSGTCP